MTTALETEFKFEAPTGAPLPDLRDLAQTRRLPQQLLRTTYFDTPDGRLGERNLSLRHRTVDGEGPGTWTLKLPHPTDGSAVERTEMSWSAPPESVPTEALEVVQGVIRREPIRLVVSLETLRQRLTLLDRKGRVVVEIDDDAVLVVGGPRDGWRFRQVELEILNPSKKLVRAVTARLEEAGLMMEETEKLAKAMGFAHRPPPSRRLGRKAPLKEVVRAVLKDGLDRLLDHDWRLRVPDALIDAHDVHQARVATRRLRSDLKTFGVGLDPVWVSHVRKDLKWVGSALGDVRDVDVLADTFQGGAPRELIEELSHQRAVAAGRLTSVLRSDRYLRTLDRLHAASHTPPYLDTDNRFHATDRAVTVVPVLVAKRWKALRRQVDRAGNHPSDRQLHRTRIKAKQLRYAAEAATRVSGKPAARVASAAEQLQTVLGQHHDAVEAKAWLEATAGRSSPSAAFEAGRLTSRQEERACKHERHWRRSWKALGKPKARSWMG